MEQTEAQLLTLEQQINSIESANINRETLAAMEKAGQAMKQIHNGLTPEKVDETMYAITFLFYLAHSRGRKIKRRRILTTLQQGQTTGPECSQRGNCQRDHTEPLRRPYR